MTLLVCREADVFDHWRRTISALRDVLPENGGHYIHRPDPSSFSVELTVGKVPSETTHRYAGGRVPIVPFLDVPTGQPSTYWIAWHEGWRLPQARSRSKSRQFRSSSITIYSGLPGCAKTQVLRAEWAGAEAVSVGSKTKIRFQGNGAAHPHWHLAGLDRATVETGGLAQFDAADTETTALAAFAEAVASADPNSDRITHAGSADLPRLADIAPAWARIHLAASARWAQEEWNGPGSADTMHAFNPADCGEIRSWIVSCVRYLQSELQGQVRRRRM